MPSSDAGGVWLTAALCYGCRQTVKQWQDALGRVPGLKGVDSLQPEKSAISEELNLAWARHEVISDNVDEVRVPLGWGPGQSCPCLACVPQCQAIRSGCEAAPCQYGSSRQLAAPLGASMTHGLCGDMLTTAVEGLAVTRFQGHRV